VTADGRTRGVLTALASPMDAASGALARLREDPYPAQVGLRVDPESEAAVRAGEALGIELPVEPNTAARSGERSVLWLGPDEWLVVEPAGREAETELVLREALAGEGAVVDLSANRTALLLSGPSAREVLATCCALDLHPRAFGPGDCAQTLVAQAQAIIELVDDTPAFRVLVRPSFAAYVAEWLLDGVRAVAEDARLAAR
jgi:sarcosine oxidase, subunit gamma